MEKTLKLTIPNEFSDLINELEKLPSEDCSILKQSKLLGTETVLLITAIVKLTETVIELISKYYAKKSEEEKKRLKITLDGENILLQGMSEIEIRNKLVEVVK